MDVLSGFVGSLAVNEKGRRVRMRKRWRRNRTAGVICASEKGENEDQESTDFGSLVPSKKLSEMEDEYLEENPLFDLISKVPPPELVARFNRSSPPEVQAAFRTTLMEMIGSLPSAMFPVQVRTLTKNVVQLMQTCIMTGYMFRSAQYRLSLIKSLNRSALEGRVEPVEVDIIGGSLVSDETGGSLETEVKAQEYVDSLRSEVEVLKSEISRYRTLEESTSGNLTNELTGYITSLDSNALSEMTNSAGVEVIDAMRKLIDGVLGKQTNPSDPVETSLNELATLLLFNMVSGYFLKEAEVRYNLDKDLGLRSST
uniref:Uncharacterized protein n=1 Tax=Rhodosorus marinus TaxID=101924 RepID=A0A7S0BNB6_9RHOD|mmetsp:Transcript_22687/g.32659  ORF Transcript_22687/g.32659 Transcript_22687/m.32659 type:complete len:313 (+) Transcript_22687:189-1127(+)|eukprot:CAMPEP_0184747006 /NCGR_PEP_ID=MMETSP0315-20130426/9435_1 /TAXON_ID=101924 /ORGANISM="Rhodosorus marinus, Strain UTEX LB 2760" /LENGTH=312 /DNA_ID=CAMNT_0027219759 /DNA_START=134 /DNA_END=1072 /DNA_ORIENTATION=+